MNFTKTVIEDCTNRCWANLRNFGSNQFSIPTVYMKVKSTFIDFLQLLFVTFLPYCSSLNENGGL
jgi:hypothetical protein